jgi:hypothetical protein
VLSIRSNWPRQKPPAHAPLPLRSARSMARPSLRPIIRSAQFPIERAAPPTYPFPRFPPLEAFGRRPPVHAAPLVSGRHPKPFTIATEMECPRYVRFPPNSDRRTDIAGCLKRPITGLMYCTKQGGRFPSGKNAQKICSFIVLPPYRSRLHERTAPAPRPTLTSTLGNVACRLAEQFALPQ